jgi:uncharacterized protein YbaA (DUF1428 family)
MAFINGMVAAVPKANKQAFIDHAISSSAIFKEYGALSVVDNWAVDVPDGTLTSFPMAVKKTDDEEVVFSWITWPSKEVADGAWEQIMQDPRMSQETNPMPFDGKRLIFGGFETIVEA